MHMLDIRCLDNPVIFLSHLALASCLLCDSASPWEESSSQRHFSKYKPIQTSHPHSPPLSGSYTPDHYLPALNTPRSPGARQLGTALVPQSLLRLLKWANPKSAYPASPLPSLGNHIKTLAHSPPLSLCLLTDPDAYPGSLPMAWHASSSRALWITNSLYNGSHLMFCWPYHT